MTERESDVRDAAAALAEAERVANSRGNPRSPDFGKPPENPDSVKKDVRPA